MAVHLTHTHHRATCPKCGAHALSLAAGSTAEGAQPAACSSCGADMTLDRAFPSFELPDWDYPALILVAAAILVVGAVFLMAPDFGRLP